MELAYVNDVSLASGGYWVVIIGTDEYGPFESADEAMEYMDAVDVD